MISLSRWLHSLGRLGLPLAITASLLSGATTAQAQTFTSTPLSVTGYNFAGIINGTPTNTSAGIASARSASTGPSTVNGNGTLDTFSLYYATGFDSDAPTTGIPVGTTFSSAAINSFGTGTVNFALANASTASATPNIALLYNNATSNTLTLSSPGMFSGLSFLTTAFQGAQTVTYTLNYATGSAVTGTFTSPDNFNGSNTALVINGRVAASSNTFLSVNSGNPRLYESDITAVDSTRVLNSVTFTETSLSGTTNGSGVAIFSITGIRASAAPEPSGVALLALAGLPAVGMIARRRRKAA